MISLDIDNDNEQHYISIKNPLVSDNDIIDNDIIDNEVYNDKYTMEVYEIEDEKNCVICLEIYDNKINPCILHSNLINAECDCKYYIHKTCFAKWLKNRPTNEMNCLICSSKAKPLLTYEQLCDELVRKPCCKQTVRCIYKMVVWFSLLTLCWLFLGILEEHFSIDN